MKTVVKDAPVEAPPGDRDGDMWHAVLDGSRFALCGVDLGRGSGNPKPYDRRTMDCLVCVDLAERFIDGTWQP